MSTTTTQTKAQKLKGILASKKNPTPPKSSKKKIVWNEENLKENASTYNTSQFFLYDQKYKHFMVR